MTGRRSHGEGTIYKYRNGWAAAVDAGWNAGKRDRRFVYGKTQQEVASKLKKLHAALESGERLDVNPTVEAFLEHWITEVLPGTVRIRTENSYVDIVRRHIVPVIGPVKLRKLSPADVRKFIRTKQTETSARGRPHSARSIQYMHAVLRRGIEHARREEIVIRNVAALVEPPKVRRAEVEPFSVNEAKKLLSAAESDRLYALYAVALGLGLRKGEALGLRWSDIDFEDNSLYVRSSLQRINKQGLQLTEPKTLRSKRRIPLPDLCLRALRSHQQAQLVEASSTNWFNQYSLVFTTSIGTPLEPRNVTRHYTALCERAGVPVRRFHDLRHTCASLLLAQGVDARTIMDTLGHSMIGTTMNLYAHVTPSTQRAAASQMDAIFGALGSTNGSTEDSERDSEAREEDEEASDLHEQVCAGRDSNPQPSDP